MITKFSRSWQIFKASIAVTVRHRKLLWFPILTTALTGIIAIFFVSAIGLPLALHHTGYHLNQTEHWTALRDLYFPAHPAQLGRNPNVNAMSILTGNRNRSVAIGPWVSLALLAAYFTSMFLATFFNVAFYSEIISALNGKGVSFRRGLGVARSRLASILAWSLLAGLVGWLIRTIEERLPFIARIVTGLVGIAWSVAAVFAIPVIVQEQPIRNPIKILKQSAATLRRTWGESIIGYVGFSAGNTVIFGAAFLLMVLALALAIAFTNWWLFLFGAVACALIAIIGGYISSVANHVYRCALYMYASEGVVPEPYSQELLDMAWKVKSSPGSGR